MIIVQDVREDSQFLRYPKEPPSHIDPWWQTNCFSMIHSKPSRLTHHCKNYSDSQNSPKSRLSYLSTTTKIYGMKFQVWFATYLGQRGMFFPEPMLPQFPRFKSVPAAEAALELVSGALVTAVQFGFYPRSYPDNFSCGTPE